MAEIKLWVLKKENDINADECSQTKQIPNKHIEVERTAGFMKYVWMIGGLLCIALMRSTKDYTGLFAGAVGICILFLVGRIFTTKSQKNLHLICYAKRTKQNDDYYAIDIATNELLYVQQIFPDKTGDDTNTYYGFEPIAFDNFKQYINNCSERLYKKIENITNESINKLYNVQFGDTVSSWINFIIKEQDEVFRLGCASLCNNRTIPVKYVELKKDIYESIFNKNEDMYWRYKTFINTDFSLPKYEAICYVDRNLSEDEIKEFIDIYDSKEETTTYTDEKTDTLFIKDFIKESTSSGNATVADINAMEFFKGLEKKPEPNFQWQD